MVPPEAYVYRCELDLPHDCGTNLRGPRSRIVDFLDASIFGLAPQIRAEGTYTLAGHAQKRFQVC